MLHSSLRSPEGPALASPATERHARLMHSTRGQPNQLPLGANAPTLPINRRDTHHGLYMYFSTHSQGPIFGFVVHVQGTAGTVQLGSVQSTIDPCSAGKVFRRHILLTAV
jgi:hypothetical protein